MSEQYLFSRRQFFQTTAATTATLALGQAGIAQEKKADEPKAVTIGSGKSTFTLDPNWGKLKEKMNYGHGCAIVVDSKDRIIVTSRSTNPCVAIFDAMGNLLETWSKEIAEKIGYTPQEIAQTAHGLYWSKEKDGEFLYWTENVHAPKGGPKIGARVYKTDMQGKVLYEIGNVKKKEDNSQVFDFTNPTDVAVAPNGDIYVVDGYGSQKVHHFDKNFKLIKTIGGPGKDHGKFSTCHGIWVSTLKKDPEVYIADRANNRLEVFSPELEYKRTVPGMKAPCCFYQHDGKLYIPELSSRVTVIDADDKVVAHMGDGSVRKKDEKPEDHPEWFIAPHALTLDSKGNLYVLEWVPYGRVRKFKA